MVEGIMITHGYSADTGGGIKCEGSSPTLILVFVSHCESVGDGGGLACHDYSSPVLDECIFDNNQAGDDGGGLYAHNFSSPDLDNCLFRWNIAVDRGGGALFVVNSFPTVDGCTFYGNSAAQGGGAAFTYAYGPVTDCMFYDNEATGSGGGLHCYGNAQCTITGCTIVQNTAPNGAGVWCRNNSSPSFNNTIIAFNITGQALGRHADDCNPTFVCCDIYGNDGGDWIGFMAGYYLVGGNFAGDPYFCDPLYNDFTLHTVSLCAAANNPGCGRIGALGVDCFAAPVGDELPALSTPRLIDCSPNPFNPTTKVRYELAGPGPVDLRVFDLAGRLVRVLKAGDLEQAGRRDAEWDGRDDEGRLVAAGVYICRLAVGEHRDVLRMALVK